MTSTSEIIIEKSRMALDRAKLPHWDAVLEVLASETSVSSSGFPFISQVAFQTVLNHVPHLFMEGHILLQWLSTFEANMGTAGFSHDEAVSVKRALAVLRNITFTAGITAPPDLWILRQILSVHRRLGINETFLANPEVDLHAMARSHGYQERQLRVDMDFLHSRGLLDKGSRPGCYKLSELPQVTTLYKLLPPIDLMLPDGILPLVERSLQKDILDPAQTYLMEMVFQHDATYSARSGWVPGRFEVETGYRLLPIVLALRTVGHSLSLKRGESLFKVAPTLNENVTKIIHDAGLIDHQSSVTALGERVFARGPGPFGIIRAYHTYTRSLEQLIKGDAVHSWVARGENVAASQDANRKTFELANEALDRFSKDFGFAYEVFIEHAVGQGEATRQRFQRDKQDKVSRNYFGADLEDAAIDKAEEAQRRGVLPAQMQFIRSADIGEPDHLLAALKKSGLNSQGSVMMVGNGFHEVRQQTNERMIEVFRGYCAAGIIIIFTEESGLSNEDLRATGWNTYHAGFRYVHEVSGQGLRPANDFDEQDSASRYSWKRCAKEAGYEVVEAYTTRTRTIYPFPKDKGYNPSISVNYFCVPEALWQSLILQQGV